MIFYFSGTGNTRWAAIRLASATQERLIDIAEEMRRMKTSGVDKTEPFILKEGERLGFVFPVHGWRVPRLVREFIAKLQVNLPTEEVHPNHESPVPSPVYAYAVCTAGDSIGLTIENLNETIASNSSLSNIGVHEVASSFSLIMPESYVGLPFMDVDPKEKEIRKRRSQHWNWKKSARKFSIVRKVSANWSKVLFHGFSPRLWVVSLKKFSLQTSVFTSQQTNV